MLKRIEDNYVATFVVNITSIYIVWFLSSLFNGINVDNLLKSSPFETATSFMYFLVIDNTEVKTKNI